MPSRELARTPDMDEDDISGAAASFLLRLLLSLMHVSIKLLGFAFREIAGSGRSGLWQSLLEAFFAARLRRNHVILLVWVPSRVSVFCM